MVKDYVTCAECGITIDSGLSLTDASDIGTVFFCSVIHKIAYLEKNNPLSCPDEWELKYENT